MNFWSRQVVRTPSQQQQPPSEQAEQLIQSTVHQENVEHVNHVLQEDISASDSNISIPRQSGNFKTVKQDEIKANIQRLDAELVGLLHLRSVGLITTEGQEGANCTQEQGQEETKISELAQPGLLAAIISIAKIGSAADMRRSQDVFRTMKTLTELQVALKSMNYRLSRSGSYLRLLPAKSNTIEGKKTSTNCSGESVVCSKRPA